MEIKTYLKLWQFDRENKVIENMEALETPEKFFFAEISWRVPIIWYYTIKNSTFRWLFQVFISVLSIQVL